MKIVKIKEITVDTYTDCIIRSDTEDYKEVILQYKKHNLFLYNLYVGYENGYRIPFFGEIRAIKKGSNDWTISDYTMSPALDIPKFTDLDSVMYADLDNVDGIIKNKIILFLEKYFQTIEFKHSSERKCCDLLDNANYSVLIDITLDNGDMREFVYDKKDVHYALQKLLYNVDKG